MATETFLVRAEAYPTIVTYHHNGRQHGDVLSVEISARSDELRGAVLDDFLTYCDVNRMDGAAA